MKLKDVGFFQRHLEKVVLGIGGLFLLVVAVMYLIADPYNVQIANQRLAPGEVPQVVRDRAEVLDRRLSDEETIGRNGQLPPVPDVTAAFRPLLDPQLPQMAMFPIGGGPMAPGDFEPPVDPNERYYVPRPRMPENVVARAANAALASRPQGMNNRVFQDIVRLVGNEEPRDFRYVSVDGEFNLDQWQRQLEHKPDGAEGLQIRRLWWARMVGVAGVYLQRQEYDPITEEWGETVTIDALPHQIALPARVDWTAEQAQEAIRFIRDNQPLVQRPEFVPVRNQQWRPPHQMPAPLGPEELQRLRRLNSDIESLQDRISRLERTLNVRPGGRAPGSMTPQQQRAWQQIERQRQDLEQMRHERDELLGLDVEPFQEQQRRRDPRTAPGRGGQWEQQWPDPDEMYDDAWMDDPVDERGQAGQFRGGPNVPPWQRQAEEEARTPMQPEEQEERVVHVWAHDLTVEPGRTYRYRLVVSVLNPLFRQDRVPNDQREEYFNKIALSPDEQTLAAAPWTDPVHVAPEYYFFLVGGSAENETAEVEVWRIYDGQWRRGEFRIRPGDPIAGTAQIERNDGRRIELNMQADAVLVDLIRRSAPTGGGRLGGGGDGIRMLYLDKRYNIMADRSVEEDSESVERMRLESEITLQQALLQQARANSR